MKYKLLVADIDGTLVDRHGNISAEDREGLADVRRAGMRVTLSTGRVLEACRKVITGLGLDGYHIFFDGALVSDSQGNEVYAKPLDSAVVRQAVELARLSDIYLELYSVGRYFVERETWASELHRRFFDLEPTVASFDDLWKRERLIKAEMMTSSPDEVARVTDFCGSFNGSLHFSWARTPAYPGVHFINVVSPEVSKGKALETLASHLRVSMDEIVAIGDGVNDISLLSAAGLAIAMQDAPDEVKAVADHVTLDVEHSGLAAAIKKILL